MEKIKSIKEAYSREPAIHEVSTQETYNEFEKFKHYPDMLIKEIRIEQINIGDPAIVDVFMAYVGYNFEGKKLFQYRVDSVNVHYKVD